MRGVRLGMYRTPSKKKIMYQKIIPSDQIGSDFKVSDVLIHWHRDQLKEFETDDDVVTISFWKDGSYASTHIAFGSDTQAQAFIRDFSAVSATDYVDELARDL